MVHHHHHHHHSHSSNDDDENCCCCGGGGGDYEFCNRACCVCGDRASNVDASTTGTFCCCWFWAEGEPICCGDDTHSNNYKSNKSNNNDNNASSGIPQVQRKAKIPFEKLQENKRIYDLRLKLRPELVHWVENNPNQKFPLPLQKMMSRLIVLGKNLLDLNPELSGGKHVIHVLAERNDLIQLQELSRIVGPAWFNFLKEAPIHKTGALNFQSKRQQQQQQQLTTVSASTTTSAGAPPSHSLASSNNSNSNHKNSFEAFSIDVNPLSGSTRLFVNGDPLSPLSSGAKVLLPEDLATDIEVIKFVSVRRSGGKGMKSAFDEANEEDDQEDHQQQQENKNDVQQQKFCLLCGGSGKEACSECHGFAHRIVEERGWFFCCVKTRKEVLGCSTCDDWGATQCKVCSGSGLFSAE
jgi:hypothetical protein